MKQFNFKEFENKLVKHYWSDCLDPFSGRLLLNEIDGSEDFSCIPTDRHGYIEKFSIGELRDLVSRVIVETRKHAYDVFNKTN